MTDVPFGRYRLQQVLGRGGQGEVWRAYDVDTRRIVAVKLLPEHLVRDSTFRERFSREAFMAASLNDPNIVPIHNFGEIDGRLYVDMRLIEGHDLNTAILDGGPMAPARAVNIIDQVASALQAAHDVGLVHRDVKPSNIILTDDDFVYLIDFGIARAKNDPQLTHGGIIGTWEYMSPERFSNDDADARADVYALACVLYQCLTARTPFPGTAFSDQYNGHTRMPVPRPSLVVPTVPPQFDRVIAVGMAKNPDQRFHTTEQLAAAAKGALAATRPRRRIPLPRPWPPPTRPPNPLPGNTFGQIPIPPPKRNTARALLIALSILVVVAIGTTVAWIATRDTTVAKDERPPRDIDTLLPDGAQLSRLTAIPGLKSTFEGRSARDLYDVDPAECYSVMNPVGQDSYRGSGVSELRWLQFGIPSANHVVVESVARFEHADAAIEFVSSTTSDWNRCEDEVVTVLEKGFEEEVSFTISNVSSRDGLWSASYRLTNNPDSSCRHQIEAVDVYVVEAEVCTFGATPKSDAVADEIRDRITS